MSDVANANYYAQRVAVARELAETASDPRAAEAHLEMANRYEALAAGSKAGRPTLHIGYTNDNRDPAL